MLHARRVRLAHMAWELHRSASIVKQENQLLSRGQIQSRHVRRAPLGHMAREQGKHASIVSREHITSFRDPLHALLVLKTQAQKTRTAQSEPTASATLDTKAPTAASVCHAQPALSSSDWGQCALIALLGHTARNLTRLAWIVRMASTIWCREQTRATCVSRVRLGNSTTASDKNYNSLYNCTKINDTHGLC